MAEVVVLEAQMREGRGSHKAAWLRKQGFLPAVMYGHQQKTVSLAIPRDEFVKAVRHGARVVDLKVGGQIQKALIQELQWDHLGIEMLHVDFARVSADERIKVEVRLELRGIAPGATGGGLVDQPMHNLLVECLAIAVPESIRVNIGELQVGQAIKVRDLHLPEGVKALADPDAIVVHVITPAAEPAPAEVAPTAAEPEVITRAKPAEEEEGE